MIIDLPKNFRFESRKKGSKNPTGIAQVEDGILYICGDISFKKVMYNITYCLKGTNRCVYCGKVMKRKDVTLDHAYVQDMGGPTIPNNLEPCCAKCNSQKSNFSQKQYARFLLLDKADRKIYHKNVRVEQELMRKNGMYDFPSEWLTQMSVQKFIVRVDLDKRLKGKEYCKIKARYKEYGNLPKPIITDMDGFMLDGFASLMIAKEEGLKLVPVIVLENVKVKF